MDLKTTKEEKVKKPKKKKNKERERERVTAFVVVLSSREVFLSVRRKRESLREIFLSAISSITANKSRQIEDKDGDVRRGRGEQFQPVELSREPHETTRDVVAVR